RFRDEPDRLPRLMRLPESPRVEVFDAFADVMREIGLRHTVSSYRLSVITKGSDNREPTTQSPALIPFRSLSHMAAVKSAVVPVPPMSRVRCCGPEARTLAIASWIRVAADVSPMWRNIRTADCRSARGFALFWPAMSGALPCTASPT